MKRGRLRAETLIRFGGGEDGGEDVGGCAAFIVVAAFIVGRARRRRRRVGESEARRGKNEGEERQRTFSAVFSEISQSVKVAEASVFTLTPPPLLVVAVLEVIVQLSNVASEPLKTSTPPPNCVDVE